MPEKTYTHVRRLFRETAWAIEPAALELMIEIVERRIEGQEPSDEAKAAAIAAARGAATPAASSQGSIAVLPVRGILTHRMGQMVDVSTPGTPAEAIQTAFTQLARDPHVAAIVLDVDSPGGSVHGIQELGDAIHAARGSKPIVAVANARAGSAAYWIASQADQLVVTPSGEVGSIGVFTAHDDLSKAAEQKGMKRTYISAGRFKTEGNPHEPLSDEARAAIQSRVDRHYDTFVRAVARGRGVSLSAVRDGFGEGRMVGAAEAVRLGMADRVETIQGTIERLQAKAARAAVAGSRAEATGDGTRAENESAPEEAVAAASTEPAAAAAVDPHELAVARQRLALAELAGG